MKNKMKDKTLDNILDYVIEKRDINIIKEILENKKQKMMITDDKMEILKFVNKSISSRKKNEEKKMIRDLILLTGDIDYIKQCEISGLDDWQLDWFDKERIRNYTSQNQVQMPEGMTFGIEIETEGERSIKLQKWKKAFKNSWNDDFDTSLDKGIEVSSPKFKTGEKENQKSSKEIKSMCAIIEGFSQKTTKRCGGHIHIGADYFNDIQDWKNFIEMYANTESLLFTITNADGQIPRSSINKYAPPIARKIDTIKGELSRAKSIDEFLKIMKKVQPTIAEFYHLRDNNAYASNNNNNNNDNNYNVARNKCSAINFLNVGLKNKNTIEFRIPNGTINPNIWIDNINLFGGLMRTSKKLTAIQKKDKSQLTEKDREMLENFEILKQTVNERQKLSCLLNLTVEEETKKRFLERYVVNNKLIMLSDSSRKVYKKMYSGRIDLDEDEER